jgi:hypothetical protein
MYDYLVQCMKELAKPEPDIESLLPWNFSHLDPAIQTLTSQTQELIKPS